MRHDSFKSSVDVGEGVRASDTLGGVSVAVSRLQHARIGYFPYSRDLTNSGDKRRFPYYARARGIPFEIAEPTERYDLVVLAQNADISRWSRYAASDAKVVYDYPNSYLAVPRSSIKGWLRGPAKFLSGQSRRLQIDFWKAQRAMFERADAVVCTTEEQALAIRSSCPVTSVILDIQTEVERATKNDYRTGEVFNLVWEGLPGNLYAFRQLRRVFAELSRRRSIALHCVTNLEFRRYMDRFGTVKSRDMLKGLCDRVFMYEWNAATCASIICAADLAVIPIDLSDPLVRGKPENKLVLFWRLGMPAITSATPAYERAMAAAGLQMTCRSESEWYALLDRYTEEDELRQMAGKRGRKCADAMYSEARLLQQWDQVLCAVLKL